MLSVVLTRRLQQAFASSAWYDATQQLVGKGRAYRLVVREYARPRPGLRVLDVGCGTGELLPYLPAVHYVGFDISESHITTARQRHGSRGCFRVGDVGSVELRAHDFDLAIIIGVLHHLDDSTVTAVGQLLARALRPGARAVFLEPCRLRDQPLTATVTQALDKGAHIREPRKYHQLLRSAFDRLSMTIRTDVLWFPTRHVVFEGTTRPDRPPSSNGGNASF
jgi:SAM-dependent methyltransferase